MREIKFRAWDKVEGMFIDISKIGFYEDGSLWYLQSQDDNENEIDPPYFDSDLGKTWELMQYKQLNDRHGTEIYDSDVLADENGHHYFVDDENDWEEIKRKVARNELEVIGNIYENPELLEESK